MMVLKLGFSQRRVIGGCLLWFSIMYINECMEACKLAARGLMYELEVR